MEYNKSGGMGDQGSNGPLKGNVKEGGGSGQGTRAPAHNYNDPGKGSHYQNNNGGCMKELPLKGTGEG